ncbi:MAG: hypothetical protein KJP23_31085 [Deltaproteobacteria bacterium]|nr:hypothetical protein [Deltaproteobacteria bacterium]
MPAITKEQIDTLIKLQQTEIKAARQKTFLAKVPGQISRLEQQLEEFVSSVENDEAALAEFNKQYRTYESDVQLNLAKIQKSEEKLRSVKTNKEYQSSLKEIDDIKAINSKLEDEMLEFLEKIETAEKTLKERKKHYTEIVEDSNQQKDSVKKDAEQREKTIVELESDRSQIAAGLDTAIIEIYNRVKAKQIDGVAIAAVVDAVCQGCNMNIPPQTYNELQRRDSLKYCPSCDRIIYWKDQDERLV